MNTQDAAGTGERCPAEWLDIVARRADTGETSLTILTVAGQGTEALVARQGVACGGSMPGCPSTRYKTTATQTTTAK
jgi:hypothetical protein